MGAGWLSGWVLHGGRPWSTAAASACLPLQAGNRPPCSSRSATDAALALAALPLAPAAGHLGLTHFPSPLWQSFAGKFDESRKLSNGQLMDFAHIYPMDAVFDTLDDVPQDVRV